MRSNTTANVWTGILLSICLFVLFSSSTPSQMKEIALIGMPLILLARIFRYLLDRADDKAERREIQKAQERRELDMVDDNNDRPFYPVARYSSRPPYFPFTQDPEDPLAVLSRKAPDLAHDILESESQDRLTLGLANSSAAAEFARQGKGTLVAAKRRRGWFGTKSTETAIKPIE